MTAVKQSLRAFAFAIVASLVTPAIADERGGRHGEGLGLPDWLRVTGEVRARYETLDGQFRAGGGGGDQILVLRSLALVEADAGAFTLGVEFQDSRAYLDDPGTPISPGIVNPLDVLQAYIRLDLQDPPGFEETSLTLGRQTLSIGSQRVLERVDMANVIASFAALYWRGVTTHGDELHVTAFAPVARLPDDLPSMDDNRMSGDEEQWGRRAWGVHWRDRNFADIDDLWAEVYLYGLHEQDASGAPTPNRDYLQPGVRLSRAARPGVVDFEFEAARRTGSRRQSSAPGDIVDLKVDAAMLYAHAGYTFDHPWRPRIALDYIYASGDSDPLDGRYGQFERLFGARRADLGNTGIHGPLTPANINAPGWRIEIAPGARIDARLAYKAAFLAESRDAWVDARLVDPQGLSGSFIGHAWDLRSRLWLVAHSLRMEVGASALIPGGFARRAPGGPRPARTLFGYVQLTQSF